MTDAMRAAAATAALLAGALAAAVTQGAELASNVNAVRSNDGLGHWIYVIPVKSAVKLPGSSRAREYPGDRDRADAILGLSCRAGEGPITAWLRVDIGPGEPDALTFFDNPVKALWLEWRDRDWTSREVRVRIAGTDGSDDARSSIRRRVVTYDDPRPDWQVSLQAARVLEAVGAGGPIRIEIEGEQIRIEAKYAPEAALDEAAQAMRKACAVDE